MCLQQCEKWVQDNMESSPYARALNAEEMFQSLRIVDEGNGMQHSVVTKLWGLSNANGRKGIEQLARTNLVYQVQTKITDVAEKRMRMMTGNMK